MNPELHKDLVGGEPGPELVEEAQALGEAAEEVVGTSEEVLASPEQAPSPELRESVLALDTQAGEVAEMLEQANPKDLTPAQTTKLGAAFNTFMLVAGTAWFVAAVTGHTEYPAANILGGFGMAGQGLARLHGIEKLQIAYQHFSARFSRES